MRILFIDQFSEWGGAQQCLRDILREVGRRGWEAEVMAPGEGPLLAFARESGFDAAELPLGRYRNGQKSASDFFRFATRFRSCVRAIGDAVRTRPPDLIYVNGPRALPAAATQRVPILFHAHSAPRQRYVHAMTTHILRRRHAAVIACSDFAAGPIRRWLGHESVHVIYNGVSDHGLQKTRCAKLPVRIGIIGRISPEKGHLDFVRAARDLADRKDVAFRVIGSALFSEHAFEQRVKAIGKGAGVEFFGWTEDVGTALGELDVLAVPCAAHDAGPRAVLDAFSSSTCVIAYPSGGIPELIRDGENGLLTSRASHEELAKLVRLLASDPKSRERLAINGRRTWEERFRVERFAAEICDAISDAVIGRELCSTGPRFSSPMRAPKRDETLAAP